MFKFKICIFDLDYTLWDGEVLYPDTIKILKHLFSSGVSLYVSSRNANAVDCCKNLGIYNYFINIQCTMDSKVSTINKILTENINVEKSNVIFYDDSFKNLIQVSQSCGICTRLIRNGIKYSDIISHS
jgi:FMN phosphatase YigB (HAD superfamily)